VPVKGRRPCVAKDRPSRALEEDVLDEVADGAAPTVRLWGWATDAVTVGRFQCLEDEVDLDEARARRCALTRRMSGGGAMYHSRGGELAFSITAPQSMLGEGIRDSYAIVSSLVVRALGSLGLDARVEGVNSVLVGGRKVSGNAQRRSRGVVQHHGTLLNHADEATMRKVLLAGRRARWLPVTGVWDEVGCDLDDVRATLQAALLEGREHATVAWGRPERELGRHLADARYSSPGWVLSR
jgi:lipoate-protein ligase A